jgi:hypothetical protein
VHKALAALEAPSPLTRQERMVPLSEAAGVSEQTVSTAPGISVKAEAPFLH